MFLRNLESNPNRAVRTTKVESINHVKETGKSFIVEASLDILGLQHFCFKKLDFGRQNIVPYS
jgi:hypothetical protein